MIVDFKMQNQFTQKKKKNGQVSSMNSSVIKMK